MTKNKMLMMAKKKGKKKKRGKAERITCSTICSRRLTGQERYSLSVVVNLCI